MSIPIATAGPAVVLEHCREMLRLYLPAYLTANESGLAATGALDLTVSLPLPNSVYLGVVEPQQGDYPSIGLYMESQQLRPMTSACYQVEYRVAATVSLYSGTVGGPSSPTTIYAAAMAYVAAVVECLSTEVARHGVLLGIYDSVAQSMAAEQSPHVVQTINEEQFETRRAIGRVVIRQQLQRQGQL